MFFQPLRKVRGLQGRHVDVGSLIARLTGVLQCLRQPVPQDSELQRVEDLMNELAVPVDPFEIIRTAVEGYLRAVEPPLADGELLTFHDSPHPLYLSLRPSRRPP